MMKDNSEYIEDIFRDTIRVREEVLRSPALISWINEVSNAIVSGFNSGGKVILAGNGGSFADSQHIAAEFVGRFLVERNALPSICLGTNSSSVSAIGNDYGFDKIFSRELSCIGGPEDVFIAISTSGNSENLIMAINEAIKAGIKTFGLLGKDGGKIANMVPSFIVPSEHTARIQEIHITVGHILCELTDIKMLNQS